MKLLGAAGPDLRKFLARFVSFFSYTPLLVFSAVVSFARLLIYALILDVEDFGAVSQMLLISTLFGFFATLGTHYIVERDAPRLQHTKQPRAALAVLAQSLFVTTATAVACLTVPSLGFGLLFLSAAELALGLTHGWAQRAFATIVIESKSRLAMMQFARQMATRSVATLLAGLLVARLDGRPAAIVTAELVVTLVLLASIAASIVRKSGIGWAAVGKLSVPRSIPWHASLALMGGAVVGVGVENFDRWIAASAFDRATFGQYAFAWTALVAAQSVQYTLNNGLLPLLARRASIDDLRPVFRLARLAATGMLAGGLVPALAVWWLATTVIQEWLSKYDAAVPLLPPLIIAALFRVSDFWAAFLIVAHGERLLLLTQTVLLGCAAALWLGYTVVVGNALTPAAIAWLACSLAMANYLANAAAAWHLGWRRRTA